MTKGKFRYSIEQNVFFYDTDGNNIGYQIKEFNLLNFDFLIYSMETIEAIRLRNSIC